MVEDLLGWSLVALDSTLFSPRTKRTRFKSSKSYCMVADIGIEDVLDFAMSEVDLRYVVRHVRQERQRDECCKV